MLPLGEKLEFPRPAPALDLGLTPQRGRSIGLCLGIHHLDRQPRPRVARCDPARVHVDASREIVRNSGIQRGIAAPQDVDAPRHAPSIADAPPPRMNPRAPPTSHPHPMTTPSPTPPTRIERVCVFCGSSPGADPAYAEAARAFGDALVRRGMGLVYGGGNVGLMGIVADTVLEGGGEVLGVIPGSLAKKEVAHDGLTELIVTDDMFERKGLMMDRADAFVSLPGGVGTLDEMFEVLTWVQLGQMAKPSGLLDVGRFWEPLTEFLDGLVDARFLREQHRALLMCEDDPDRLLDRLVAWQPEGLDKWIDREGSAPAS